MLQINDDDGYLQVQLGEGEPTKLDLFLAVDVMNAKLEGWKQDDVADYYVRLKAAAAELGLPEMSGRSVHMIWEGLRDRLAEIRKKSVSPAPTL